MKNWLKELRQLNNLTQKELSDQTGITKSTIENIEQEKRKGSDETIKILNDYFNSLKNNNMQISYDNEELIEELKADIKEFGENCLMYAMFEVFQKFIVLTNYDFIDEEEPLTHDEINSYDLILELKAKDILKYLKIQNKLI